jgi:SAM-dependent methyltransferase
MKEYVSPVTRLSLLRENNSLVNGEGESFSLIRLGNFLVPEFARNDSSSYEQENAVDYYENFKEWLFKTFNEDEEGFKRTLVEKVVRKTDKQVLITGCGLGDDVFPILEVTNYKAHVHAIDLSKKMIEAATCRCKEHTSSVSFLIGDACSLPFKDEYFDSAFHFGGINCFDDIEGAIKEMTRVVKKGGRIGFGDEGVGSWLRALDYGKMAINNNSLWGSYPPIDKLPFEAMDVKLEWVLGNCFYFISFVNSKQGPSMNTEVHHKGQRGGTMKTRYYGQLEGVSSPLKEELLKKARENGQSVSEALEQAISLFLQS